MCVLISVSPHGGVVPGHQTYVLLEYRLSAISKLVGEPVLSLL